MTVTLYNCSSASNVLRKSYSVVQANISATAKGPVDVDQPTLILNYASMNFNYFYISEFGRYYNVISRNLVEGMHIQVTGQSDPLESFVSDIAALNVLAVRTEDSAYRSPELADSQIPLDSDMQLDKIVGDKVIGSGDGMIIIGVI